MPIGSAGAAATHNGCVGRIASSCQLQQHECRTYAAVGSACVACLEAPQRAGIEMHLPVLSRSVVPPLVAAV